jgi:hypothetical protein
MENVTALIEGLWSQGGLSAFFAIFVVALILAAAVGVLWGVFALFMGSVELAVWLINRRHCTHCKRWTVDRSDGEYPECRPRGRFCCSHCTFQHMMAHEPKVNCPVGGEIMDKKSIDDKLIADVCPNGHGTWLGYDELNLVQDIAYDRGHSDGHSSGLATGIIIS